MVLCLTHSHPCSLDLYLSLLFAFLQKFTHFPLGFPRNKEEKIHFQVCFWVYVCVCSSDICISINFRINEIQFDIIFRSLIKNSISLSKARTFRVNFQKEMERERESAKEWRWLKMELNVNTFKYILYGMVSTEMCNECANSTMWNQTKPNWAIESKRDSTWKGWQMHKNRRKWYVTKKIINLSGYVIVDLLFKTFTFHVRAPLPQPSTRLLLCVGIFE